MQRPLAVITGASSGIGLEFARRLAATHDLLLVARRRDRLEAVAGELQEQFGAAVEVLVADLSVEEDLARTAAWISVQPELALLVNNAGFGLRGRFWEVDVADQERMHRLHVTATLRLTHAALGVLVAKNAGAVINVASVAGFVARAGSVSYGATKTWMIAFTEGVSLDLAGAGSRVTVQALCPGFTYSEFHETMRMERAKVASPALWLTAGQVVGDSLAALRTGKLVVVPGWRYQAIVAVVRFIPAWLRVRIEGGRR